MNYYISKENKNKEIVIMDIENKGLKIKPKNEINYPGIKVNSMVLIKPSMIEKILKRKIKTRLEMYLNFAMNCDEDDDTDTRYALDDIARYRKTVNEKYINYLSKKYLVVLNKKIDILENEFQSKIQEKDFEKEAEQVNNRSR